MISLAEPAEQETQQSPEIQAKIAKLTSPDPVERAEAACRLGELKASAAIPSLIKLLGDETEALISALRDTNAQVRSQAAWALGLKGDTRAVEPLKMALNDQDEHVRKQAAWALKMRGLQDRE